jgi:hypothetical protein
MNRGGFEQFSPTQLFGAMTFGITTLTRMPLWITTHSMTLMTTKQHANNQHNNTQLDVT